LGGGSSDAACALAVGSDVWGLGLQAAELAGIAAGIGSDVPFFLRGGTCRARGRGERLAPLPSLEGTAFGLVVPPLRVPTQRVYMRINLALTRNSLNASIVQQLKSPGVGKELADSFENDLEAAALDLFPELREIREGLRALGLPVVRMTGSGGAFYFWPGEAGLLREVEARFRSTGCLVQLVKATATGFTEGDP
jgi:4-diphosphocytidyl-2-C-methyl-D-erythritol kinase